jgi:hypothetical protein
MSNGEKTRLILLYYAPYNLGDVRNLAGIWPVFMDYDQTFPK